MDLRLRLRAWLGLSWPGLSWIDPWVISGIEAWPKRGCMLGLFARLPGMCCHGWAKLGLIVVSGRVVVVFGL